MSIRRTPSASRVCCPRSRHRSSATSPSILRSPPSPAGFVGNPTRWCCGTIGCAFIRLTTTIRATGASCIGRQSRGKSRLEASRVNGTTPQTSQSDIVSELAQRVGGDAVLEPDAQNVVRHTRDYGVQGNPAMEILALTYPRSTQQISAILKFCNERRIPIQPQGGMTGLSGGGVPVGPCVVISLERMRAVRELDVAAATITVEAGVVLESVQKAAADADLFFPLDLGGRGSCQIGGNLSTNAGGNRVLRFGMARELVLGLEAVLADGTVISALSKVIKNNTGYDLRQLFIGSEGTLGIITAVVLRLFAQARSICTGISAVDDYAGVIDLLQRARAGFGPQLTAFEVMWPQFYEVGTIGLGRKPPLQLGYGAYVLIETMGFDPEADQRRYEEIIQ